jgi:serine/threonine kinase PknH
MAVFLSYAREDKEIAAQLYEELVELRGDVFMDHEIKGGQDWWDTICDSIEQTSLFVLVVSDASLESEACQSELAYARATERPVLPVAVNELRVDDLPIEIKRLHVLEYDPASKDSYKQIVKAVTAAGTAPPLPDPLPERPAMPESYADRHRRTLAAPHLTLDEQVSLFAVLRSHTSDPRRRAEALALVKELRDRRDIAVGVAADIDAFLADLPAPTGTATVVLQRMKQGFLGRKAAIFLEVDGERVGEVENGETVEIDVPAGRSKLQATAWLEQLGNRSDELEVDLAPGDRLALRVRFMGSLKGGIELLRIA